MKRERIYKREFAFSKMVKELVERWFDHFEFLFLKDSNYAMADLWKRQIYILQKDAAFALRYAHSNQHPYHGHKVVKNNEGRLVFSSQIVIKAFYLRYFMLLIQGCGDKLAQMIRCALGITKWNTGRSGKTQNANETTTNLRRLKQHLEVTLQGEGSPSQEELTKAIYEKIRDYVDDEMVKAILNHANALKHRWLLFYQGEGLQPALPRIEPVRDDTGKVMGKKVPIGAYTYGEKIETHIDLCLGVNNMFVDTANNILDQLKFERFYEVRNGKRILRP